MHEIFPLVKYKKELTNKEIDKFVLECKEKNIDRILFASQKSTSVDTIRTKSLHNYMNSLEPLKLDSNRDDNLEYDTKEIMTYIIEAAVYDIGTTTQDKPIATTTLTASNPNSVDVIKKHFLKAVVKLFDTN
ncbi:hypothetical protein [Rasiella sp. SM2506]|uniref:hypothetical protein n=1 Tax=Rasiella sp. SM2506 TaxID=3423914 RepID=UPI003D79841B